jgi:hypothetical protein
MALDVLPLLEADPTFLEVKQLVQPSPPKEDLRLAHITEIRTSASC